MQQRDRTVLLPEHPRLQLIGFCNNNWVGQLLVNLVLGHYRQRKGSHYPRRRVASFVFDSRTHFTCADALGITAKPSA